VLTKTDVSIAYIRGYTSRLKYVTVVSRHHWKFYTYKHNHVWQKFRDENLTHVETDVSSALRLRLRRGNVLPVTRAWHQPIDWRITNWHAHKV